VIFLDELVSRTHVKLSPSPTGWQLHDVSSNGTWVDGSRVSDAELVEGTSITVHLGAPDGPELIMRVTGARAAPRRSTAGHREQTAITVGREADNTVWLIDPLVSRRHAVVDRSPDGDLIRDLGSVNGTFVNGEQIDGPHPLRSGDTVVIGSTSLTWDGQILATRRPAPFALQARHLSVCVGDRTLLDDVSLSVPTSSLVAIIGPSGAGKSTLLGAMTGLRPAGVGSVTWDGFDLYDHYDQLRSSIGLVPQEDILHPPLTVRRALGFAAELRFPPDTTPEERATRVDQVLTEVELHERADQRIDSLSGGQRKRTSIALELLTAPPLLYLDEPTSGLDPDLDRQVMRVLRGLADAGRVVVVVTHNMAQLELCDRVLLLATGGRTAFYGPPSELLPFFDVATYPDLFAALATPGTVERFASSPMRQAYIGPIGAVPAARRQTPRELVKVATPLRQWWTLVRRNAAVAAADRMLLTLLVSMPLLLGALAHTVPGGAGLSVVESGGSITEAKSRIVVLVLGAALMGGALSVRELVKERAIYLREHAVGVSTPAYLVSKAVVLGTLVGAQAVVFTLIALAGVPAPDSPLALGSGRLEIIVAIAAVAIAVVMVGLAISAAVRTSDQMMPALGGLVMAQLVLCGGLVPVDGRAGLEQVAWLMPARWGYAAAAATSGMFTGQEPGTDSLATASLTRWVTNIALTLVIAIVALVCTGLILRRRSRGSDR
jgi:ABC-type multidrug transport system ATPase subunit/pSer/pThr/pTyr-binding forkhead associated (FHA) protein